MTIIQVVKIGRAWHVVVDGKTVETAAKKDDAQTLAFARARTMAPARVHVMQANCGLNTMMYRAKTFSF